ncbi:MAG TPA: helix-turn-helix domain-containing protein [Polyangiaceae bacterium]|nr:MAG: acetoacetate metabolism regulatory protein AtoC [Deltaproteobacteria bacterium ADurb.Bin207]HNS95730.1 helix-turn-helix domain-containing protein [Polyangiaceae bacterium]HNZ22979.1 helix-turn-helix domain-containing protein [Polyangiaceae bacterium]HOD24069.1 helix-turn-helix domain-containing protein [Polyangiaceae bacterium]HOE51018.1 helix-turn-helix domain-containing protein [Polyangiaceae bacterium]
MQALPENVVRSCPGSLMSHESHDMDILDPIRESEKNTIVSVLLRNAGNRSRAAAELGIHRSTLIRKIKRYGIDIQS